MMSTRPRKRDGISSSIAELIAAYSPPMPIPAMIRVRYRKPTQKPLLPSVSAVNALPNR